MTPARRLSTLCAALPLGAALLLPGGPGHAGEGSDDVRRVPPVLASRAAPVREALILAPDEPSGAEATTYRDRLRLLGFAVTTVPDLPRPALASALRRFAATVPPDADVAVLVLGTLVPEGHGLYLLPPGTRVAALPRGTVPSEGVSVTDLMGRIAGRGRDPVAILDRCGGAEGSCASALADMPAGVSALAVDGGPAGPPLAHSLLPLMGEQGLAFADLGARLGAGGTALARTPFMSRRFAFLPPGFFEGLPLACNAVDPQRGAEALRGGPPLEPLVAACEDAVARYVFSPFFSARLAAAKEQRAARAALTACGEAPAAAYLGAYPDGRYRDAVTASRQACADPPAPPRPAPPAPAAANPLQKRAQAALDDYFGRHDYQQGDTFGRLVRLYPPQFRKGQATVSRTDHLRGLGAWYGGFDSVRFEIGPASPDFNACTREDSCLVRGTVRVRTLKAGDSQYGWEEDRFALRFDLAAGQVLMECGVGAPAGEAEGACD